MEKQGGYVSKMEQKERMKIETVKEINHRIEELFAKPIEHIFPGEYGDFNPEEWKEEGS